MNNNDFMNSISFEKDPHTGEQPESIERFNLNDTPEEA